MITIKQPVVTSGSGKSRLLADVVIDGVSHPLWVEVDETYGRYLCSERSDAFVLAFLQYAMLYGHDIVCEAPMTDRLYEQLTGQFMPAFAMANGFSRDARALECGGVGGWNVKIKCSLAPEVEHVGPAAVGTGISCGVDSLHVWAKQKDVTHGCIWNGHGQNKNQTPEVRAASWTALRSRAETFCKHVGKELIVGDSNFDDGCVKGLQWDFMTTQGNLFFIFALQKLWTKYYIASDCAVENFKFKISLREDPAHYEYFLFPFVCLSKLMVRMDGADCRRIDKVGELVRYEPARHYLNTCWLLSDDHHNCSYRCPKCMRTMLNLYCHDALGDFAEVYDVKYFYAHLDQYLAEYYRGCLQRDFFITEMRPFMNEKSFPIGIKICAWWIVTKKVFRKLVRCGRVNDEFRPD